MPSENGEPGNSRAFLRRVKRVVHAPRHRFLAVTPPGLTGFCAGELTGMGIDSPRTTDAGVEFEGTFDACYAANLHLRTASRILWRLPEFRAGASEELFKKISALPWELFMNPAVPLRVETHVERSRIRHEGVARETVETGIRKKFKELGIVAPPVASRREDSEDPMAAPREQRIIVRLEDDRCSVGLDTTGAHLHLRGYRSRHTGAPLRETLAAALLMAAGWNGDVPLVDGMCGSGTFPIEAALLARKLPPGLHRRFLFEQWPGFRPETWNYLKRKALEASLPEIPVPLTAVDRDAEAVEIAQSNAQRAGVRENVRWIAGDFFDIGADSLGLPPGLVLLNPPYGLRLESDGKELYERIGAHLRNRFQGWKAAVLVPEGIPASALGFKALRLRRLGHGGLSVVAALGRV